MKAKYLVYLIIFCCLFNANIAYSNEFLRIGSGARAIGLGEAYVAFPIDVNIMNYNPAGLANLKKNQMSLMHIKWIDDFSYEYASYAIKMEKIGVMGINFRFLHHPEFDWIDGEGDVVGKIGGSWMAVTVGLGRKLAILNNNFGGINLKFIRVGLADYSSMSAAMDLGLLSLEKAKFLTFGDLKTGIAIRDVGINFKPAGDEAEKLPARLALGFSVNALNIEGLKKHDLILAMELLVKMIDRAETKTHLGFEYSLMKILYLRMGYKVNYESTGLCAGMGANFNIAQLTRTTMFSDAQLDYSVSPYEDLGVNHNVSLTVRFGGEYVEKEEIEEEVIEEEVIEEEVIEEVIEEEVIEEEVIEEEAIEEEVIEEEIIEEEIIE